MIALDRVRKSLKNLEFEQCDNEYRVTIKGYDIICGFESEAGQIVSSYINYGDEILVSHQGICNFEKEEYLVQLECIVRLLKKGYAPNQLELEKTYTLGHTDKGRLDILVKKQNVPWLMIECKTAEKYEE